MKAGAKLLYHPELLPDLLASVNRASGSLGQVADLNRIPRTTFYGWIKRGEDDMAQGLSTELAQFSYSMREEQAKVICVLIDEARSDDKSARFITWLLSKICREDFGVDGVEIKELRDVFRVLLPLLNKGHSDGEVNQSREAKESGEG